MPLKRLRKAAELQQPRIQQSQASEPTADLEHLPKKRKASSCQPKPGKKHLSPSCHSGASGKQAVEQDTINDVLLGGVADQSQLPSASVGKQKAQDRVASPFQGLGSFAGFGNVPPADLEPKSSKQNLQQQSDEEEAFEERTDDRANDPACIQCDDGGDIMWCDGSCMRAFHCGMASSEDDTPGSDDEGSEAAASISQPQLQPVHCNPLQMPLELYQRLKDTKDMFYCPNCLAGVHQCFKCKEEGVVEARAADPEIEKFAKRLVFRCGVAACGRFYHADCLDHTREEMEGAFFCPLHTCKRCEGDASDARSGKGELIPCRRCPKAFHERCMPASLLEPIDKRRVQNWKQRIWVAQFEDGECVSEVERSLIYCGKHKISCDHNNPEHQRRVFDPILLQRWKEHFASLFPTLESSKEVQKQVKDEEVLSAMRKRRSSDDQPVPTSTKLATKSAVVPAKSSMPQTAASDTGLQRRGAQQGASKQVISQQDGIRQDKATQAATKQKSAKQSSVTKDTAKQESSKQAVAKQGGFRPDKAEQANQSNLNKAAAGLSKKSASSSVPAGKVTPAAPPPSSVKSNAAGGSSYHTAAAVQLPMAPPGPRKRPALPDRSALPPKKRRATVAAPVGEGQPARVAAGEASMPAAGVQSKHVGKKAASPVATTASLSATATTEDRSAPARSELKKKPGADAPAASQLSPAALEVPSLDPASACRPTNVSHATRTAAAAAHPEHDSPVQFVEQEDLGDVDISDDLAFAPAAAEIAAAAEAEGSDTVEAELSEVAQAEHATAGKSATDGASAAAAPAPSTGTQDSDKAAPPEAATDGAPAQTAPDRAAATGRAAGALHAAAEEAGVPARMWDLSTPYARELKAMSLEQRKQESATRVQAIINAGPSFAQTLDRVKATTRQPEPYRHPSKLTVPEDGLDGMQERLQVMEKAVENATKDPKHASMFVDRKIALEMLMVEDNLSMVLAPFLHGNRYSSYGRHFTKLHLLEQVAQLLSFYLHDGDTVVDFSCGANAFVPLVKKEGRKQGLSIAGCAFDIITSQNLEDFQRCSWLDTHTGMLPHGNTLVIGLNPPFGKNNSLAFQFVQHAALTFKPRVIVLIVPPSTPLPRGYTVMYEDQTTMHDRAFFVPGATAESWNLTTPALRVLVRTEWVNRGPPNGSGWYPSITAPPRYGTHRRPRQSMPQPFIPPPLMPQQHMPWQQLPQHLPPHPMNQQHAAQQQGPKMYQQQMPQQRLLQQHVAQQHVTQQGFQPQHSVSAQRPLGFPAHALQQQQPSNMVPPPRPQMRPQLAAAQCIGRPAWLAMNMPASLPPFEQ